MLEYFSVDISVSWKQTDYVQEEISSDVPSTLIQFRVGKNI